jgi:acyl-CoA reductase-like NAD-dependent aldehyde dehydrogenase
MQLSDKNLLKTQAYIDGQWIDSDDGSQFSVTNPANGNAIADVASCGSAETRRAIAAAERAMIDWRARSAKERAGILRSWFNLMMEAQEDLAQILTAGMARVTWNGSQKKQSAFMAIRFRHPPEISASSLSSSLLAWWPVSRHGIFRMQC